MNKTITDFWFSKPQIYAMAAMRIFLGLIFVFELLVLFPERQLMFSTDGLFVPVWARVPQFPSWLHWTFQPPAMSFVFIVSLCAAVFFMIGFRARLMAVLLLLTWWYLLIANPFVFDAGSDLARNVLLFMIFAPISRAWAVDARRLAGQKIPDWQRWSPRFIQVQVSLMYASAVLCKVASLTWTDGSAVYYATRMSPMVRYEMPWIFDSLVLLKLMTFITLAIEILLIFGPWVTRWRMPVIAIGILFHFILDRIFCINTFEFICIACLLAFLKDEDFLSLRHQWKRLNFTSRRPIRRVQWKPTIPL